jgi:hypothetical protein
MARRTTRKQIESLFTLFCKEHGKKRAESYADKGAWSINYNAIYGGFVIIEYCENGGEGLPFGEQRRKAAEFWDTMHFALKSVYAVKAQKSGK